MDSFLDFKKKTMLKEPIGCADFVNLTYLQMCHIEIILFREGVDVVLRTTLSALL